MFKIKTAALLGAALCGIAMIVTLLCVFGLPLGEFTMCGQHEVIPQDMRFLLWISIVIQAFAIIAIMQAGDLILKPLPMKIARGACFFFAVYFSFNSVMNFLSDSVKERIFVTPLSVLAAICFWVVTISVLRKKRGD